MVNQLIWHVYNQRNNIKICVPFVKIWFPSRISAVYVTFLKMYFKMSLRLEYYKIQCDNCINKHLFMPHSDSWCKHSCLNQDQPQRMPEPRSYLSHKSGAWYHQQHLINIQIISRREMAQKVRSGLRRQTGPLGPDAAHGTPFPLIFSESVIGPASGVSRREGPRGQGHGRRPGDCHNVPGDRRRKNGQSKLDSLKTYFERVRAVRAKFYTKAAQ